MSRIFTELKKDFEQDLTFEYFKLAQLFDPRVCHRTYPLSLAEIIRLLAFAVSTYIPTLILTLTLRTLTLTLTLTLTTNPN